MSRILKIFAVLFVISAAASSGGVFWVYHNYIKPGPLEADTVLVIHRGSGIVQISRELAGAGVIENPFIFRKGFRHLAADLPLRAGEYRFPARAPVRDVVAILQSGKTVVRRVTLAEGMTSAAIAAKLTETPGLTGSIGAVPAEGSLLPETYHFSFGDDRRAIVARVRGSMKKLLGELWPKRAKELPIQSAEEAVILASIVEKETGVDSERARVAAVFINRLRRKMRLQSDPTVIYGLTRGERSLGRRLTRVDLEGRTPFNTYVIKGLPPTPIANPGREALRAVLHPADTDELYFVADGTGGHVFARTLKEHNRNVARWRKIRDRRRKKQRVNRAGRSGFFRRPSKEQIGPSGRQGGQQPDGGVHRPRKTDAGPVASETANDDPCRVVRFHQERHAERVAVRDAAFDEAGTDHGYADSVVKKFATQGLAIGFDGRLAG